MRILKYTEITRAEQLREELRSQTTSGTSTPAPAQTSSTNGKPGGKLSKSAKRRLKMQRKTEEASKMEKNGERQGNQNNCRSVTMDRGQGPSSSRHNQDSIRDREWSGPRDGYQDHYPTEPAFHGAPSTSRSEPYYEFGCNGNQENWRNDSRYRHGSTSPRNNNGYDRGDYQDSRRSEGVRNNYQDRSSQEHGRPYQFRDGYNGNHEYSREESRYCYDPREQDSRRNYWDEEYDQEYQPSNQDQPATSSEFDSIVIGCRFDGHQTTSRRYESRGRANGNQQNMMDDSRGQQ
ncbi:hypothetical protein CRE_22997 [Caenorhabditis remanei]|uniref:Uncharacterized protein n=1 Tax=Caenorhabditis remanei TaxID=31234 RepID=E3N4E4_CAERE|nr:hypothetical protein CRE_22997 [Caenorhabditis remanei]